MYYIKLYYLLPRETPGNPTHTASPPLPPHMETHKHNNNQNTSPAAKMAQHPETIASHNLPQHHVARRAHSSMACLQSQLRPSGEAGAQFSNRALCMCNTRPIDIPVGQIRDGPLCVPSRLQIECMGPTHTRPSEPRR